jgi:hypothetical protein
LTAALPSDLKKTPLAVAKAASTEAFEVARESKLEESRVCWRALNRVSEYVVKVENRLAKVEV